MGKSFKLGVILLCVALVIVAFFWLRSCTKNDYIELGADNAIDPTPTQIQSIRAIGEWEFLSVSLEEMTDTVRKGFFSDDELSRIYYGTLRLGINMHHVEPGWFQADGDSVSLTLPRVALLDRDFIDEAHPKTAKCSTARRTRVCSATASRPRTSLLPRPTPVSRSPT